MEITSIEDIKKALKNHYPSKKLGQNFLIDKEIVDNLVSEAEISSKDAILEIGSGLGAITKKLSKKAEQVKAAEKDKKLIKILKNNLEGDNVEIINNDILEIALEEYLPPNYKVVSNLPFNIAVPIIRKLLFGGFPPSLIVVIVQKEVAERIEAKGEKHNFLSVLIHFKATPQIISTVSRNSFWPSPRVDGSILKLTPHNKYLDDEINEDNFFKVVEAGFLHPRKQIKNNLSYLPNYSKEEVKNILSSLSIDSRKRPEVLSLEDWVGLTKKFDFKNKNK